MGGEHSLPGKILDCDLFYLFLLLRECKLHFLGACTVFFILFDFLCLHPVCYCHTAEQRQIARNKFLQRQEFELLDCDVCPVCRPLEIFEVLPVGKNQKVLPSSVTSILRR